MAVADPVLARMAQKLRRHSLESTAEAGSGHPTSCMSCAEIVSVLFFEEMQFDPKDPSGKDADVFILSKGHAAPILWAALKESGAISDDLLTLRRYDSPLEGHPTPNSPWVRVATGSLGQGLCAGAGMAIQPAARTRSASGAGGLRWPGGRHRPGQPVLAATGLGLLLRDVRALVRRHGGRR